MYRWTKASLLIGAVLVASAFAFALAPVRAQTVTIVDLVGDEDNFGYGGTANPPCVFYDFSDPIADLGIFDRELFSGDEVESWTHDFTGDPAFGPGFTTISVLIEIPEKFSDRTTSTIEIDGTTLDFTPNGFTRCQPIIIQTFSFTGAAAAFANDGIVDITFRENGDNIALDFSRLTVIGIATIEVDIDIKPGSDPNSINCNNDGKVIAVAILTTDDFDATTVDHETVEFGPDGATEIHSNKQGVKRHEADVDGDGDTDLVLHFRLVDTGLTCDSTEATLTGSTFGGQAIEGTGPVRMVPPGS